MPLKRKKGEKILFYLFSAFFFNLYPSQVTCFFVVLKTEARELALSYNLSLLYLFVFILSWGLPKSLTVQAGFTFAVSASASHSAGRTVLCYLPSSSQLPCGPGLLSGSHWSWVTLMPACTLPCDLLVAFHINSSSSTVFQEVYSLREKGNAQMTSSHLERVSYTVITQ